jgi:hypothetical protein
MFTMYSQSFEWPDLIGFALANLLLGTEKSCPVAENESTRHVFETIEPGPLVEPRSDRSQLKELRP